MRDLNHHDIKKKPDEFKTDTVLVIDDDASIREAVQGILALVDIDVISAANGKEGVELFARGQAKIGVVLLDVQMPIMSGEETYKRIRALDANIPIILSSGYGEMENAAPWGSGSVTSDNTVVLRKPYTIDGLLELVEAHL